MDKRNHSRAADKRTITVSIEKYLVDEIDALAAEDDRTRSKWIVRELKQIVDSKKIQKAKRLGVVGSMEAVAQAVRSPGTPSMPSPPPIILNDAPSPRDAAPPKPKPPRITKTRAALRTMAQKEKRQ